MYFKKREDIFKGIKVDEVCVRNIKKKLKKFSY